jgi:hypothetical protein
MRRFLLLALVTCITLSTFAQKKKDPKRELPDQVLIAQYVYVTGWHGDLLDPRTPAAEKDAISRVQSAVHEWGRYKLAYQPEQADLMLVVKPGRLGMVQGGVGGLGGPDIVMGTPPPQGRPTGSANIGYGADAGSPTDYLMVSLFPGNPIDASYAWKRAGYNGLQGRKIPLLEEFKKAVSETEKAKAASGKP